MKRAGKKRHPAEFTVLKKDLAGNSKRPGVVFVLDSAARVLKFLGGQRPANVFEALAEQQIARCRLRHWDSRAVRCDDGHSDANVPAGKKWPRGFSLLRAWH